ncbi:MAG: hypothetical protein WAM85_03115 [Terracidiphilus sp.]
MKSIGRALLFACLLWLGLSGCGGKSSAPNPPVSDVCTGFAISGTLKDSLTNQPVAQGWAVLESGTELSLTPVYEFYPTKKVATDVHGGFSVCAQAVPNPSAIVLAALDSTGNAYPPFVASVSGATDLGTIQMGGCAGLCGLEGQQQTTAPATITGVITSAPVATAGTVVPQIAMEALDGSKAPNGMPNLWAIAIPSLNPSQNLTFNTTAGTCGGNAPFCATYTFTLPSQSPLSPANGGSVQAAVPPIYLIYAADNSTSSCSQPTAIASFQQDGTSFLIASPGAQLSAANMNFTGCH